MRSGRGGVVCGGHPVRSSGSVPPIAGLAARDPAAAALALATRRMDRPARTALVTSVASGGALFSVVLRILA